MSVAPHGQEGLYSALASSPIFISKLISGPFGGYLLAQFCSGAPVPTTTTTMPASSTRSLAMINVASNPQCQKPYMIWTVISVVSIIAPILMLVFQRYLRSKNRNLDSVQVDSSQKEETAKAVELEMDDMQDSA
jgi:mannitol-specific phosphotransferase system IIBC component